MAQYFKLTFLYTPFIKFGIDLDTSIMGAFEEDLIERKTDFSLSHLYIKEKTFNDIMLYDTKGVEIANKFAWSKPVRFCSSFKDTR